MDAIAESLHGNESTAEGSIRQHPNANSTLTEPDSNTPTWTSKLYATTWNSFFNKSGPQSSSRDAECQSPNRFSNVGQSSNPPCRPPLTTDYPLADVGPLSHVPSSPRGILANEPTSSWGHTSEAPYSPLLNFSGCLSHSVGHISHIPRCGPPKPGTYTVPSILSRTIGTEIKSDQEDMFGLIKLKNKDVCYTSGTIEWVGRKRTFPINSGFKVLDDSPGPGPLWKKSKRFDKSNLCGVNNYEDCECADVLPTVNALVDHLNALHEAVDIVDLRLNTLESVMSTND